MNTQNRQQQNNTAGLCPAPRSSSGDVETTCQTPLSQAGRAAYLLRGFIGYAEMNTIGAACHGEEGEFWKAKLVELAQIVETMPTTYETDGQGDNAIAFLHYFTPAGDFYITERDQEEEQLQAFGLACIYEDELGYISIKELIEAGAELDLYWTPKTLGMVKAERLMSDVNYPGNPMHC